MKIEVIAIKFSAEEITNNPTSSLTLFEQFLFYGRITSVKNNFIWISGCRLQKFHFSIGVSLSLPITRIPYILSSHDHHRLGDERSSSAFLSISHIVCVVILLLRLKTYISIKPSRGKHTQHRIATPSLCQ